MRWDDDSDVRDQYKTPDNLAVRTAVWRNSLPGTSPQDIIIDQLRLIRAKSVLDVGAGRGQLALRMSEELECDVVAVDTSPAMVEACRARGVEALLADARVLPFESNSFDAVAAAWMLYHVSPVEKALEEFGRVLRPGGTVVVVTNGRDHLIELWSLAGVERSELPFRRENGAAILSEHFENVRRLDVETYAYFADREAATGYLESVKFAEAAQSLPLDGWPRTMAGATSVFIASARS